jgi:hypothetical protein
MQLMTTLGCIAYMQESTPKNMTACWQILCEAYDVTSQQQPNSPCSPSSLLPPPKSTPTTRPNTLRRPRAPAAPPPSLGGVKSAAAPYPYPCSAAAAAPALPGTPPYSPEHRGPCKPPTDAAELKPSLLRSSGFSSRASARLAKPCSLAAEPCLEERAWTRRWARWLRGGPDEAALAWTCTGQHSTPQNTTAQNTWITKTRTDHTLPCRCRNAGQAAAAARQGSSHFAGRVKLLTV